jgi:hypothetical protein
VIVLAGVAAIVNEAVRRAHALRGRAHQVEGALSQLSFQAKIKVVISFYQVCSTLGTVYGVQVDQFRKRLSFMDAINLDVLELSLPSACLGCMKKRIVFSATWPYAFVLFVVGLVTLHTTAERKLLKNNARNAEVLMLQLLRQRAFYAVILVFYLVLPSVSRSLFRARQCESFEYDDNARTSRSYLLAELKIDCDTDNDKGEWNSDKFEQLQPYFWAFFALWPVLVPLIFFGLLLFIRPTIRAQRISPLALTCSFLWRDYESAFLFWEMIDLVRKLFRTTFIHFIDTSSGSSRILRLITGAAVSGTYLALLAFARPYQRFDDLQLAALANLLLTLIFTLSIVIKLCNDFSCSDLIGVFGSDGAISLVILLTAILLSVFIATIAFQVATAASAPRIKLVSTRSAPVLDLPVDCKFH